MPKPKIFISHSHADYRVASRFQALLEWASAHGVDIARSSQQGAIKTGADWYAWIDAQVLDCDVAIVVLTPGSFRGAWVMWEAGAVAGVQRARSQSFKTQLTNEKADHPGSRRVRVVGFRLTDRELGPFQRNQVKNGLSEQEVVTFVEEILEDFRSDLDSKEINKNLRKLDDRAKEFVAGAAEDLRFTPIFASEDVVQEWLARIDRQLAKDDHSWLASARRWINVAILGAGRADDLEPIDFRIHSRLAQAHEAAKDWTRAIEELELARTLSPNDLPILTRLGKALLSAKLPERVSALLESIKELDARAFVADREAVALRCRYLAEAKDWAAVDAALAEAEPSLLAKDEYLATWRALASMRVNGAERSRPLFVQLADLTAQRTDFWGLASHVNAALALGRRDDVVRALAAMDLNNRTAGEVASATRYYAEIAETFRVGIDWRKP
jgi:tetratricopeptide (TPR) repeat protein